ELTVNRGLGQLDRDWRVRGNCMRDFFRSWPKRVRRHALIDQPPGKRLFGIDLLASKDHLLGASGANRGGESARATPTGKRTDLHFGRGRESMGGGDAQLAGQGAVAGRSNTETL